jgi:hypothetical protein
MTDLTATGRRLAKVLPLLGSDQPGEVTAAAAGLVRVLNAGGMDLNDLAGVLAAELERRAKPAFSFATLASRTARKQIALLAWREGVSLEDRARMERMRAWLLGKRATACLPDDDIQWLDALWRQAFGGGG